MGDVNLELREVGSDIFDNLVIFDMANNHMGDVEHGKRIIRAIVDAAIVTQPRRGPDPLQIAVKFQFREIEPSGAFEHGGFIHPSADPELPYVKRFRETALNAAEFIELAQYVKSFGFVTVCTPFDEISVNRIFNMGNLIDIVKIASCSFTDWPLLNKIAADINMPIIASTAGAEDDDIGKVLTFFENRKKKIALMHCVGEYPTQRENLQLQQIEELGDRFHWRIPIGYSTHEEPDNMDAVKMAVAYGATIFERHAAVETEEYVPNAYSSTPQQMIDWIQSIQDAMMMRGDLDRYVSEKERADLQRFKRGVYLKNDVAAGEYISRDDVVYAFPNVKGQIVANDMSKYLHMKAKTDMVAGTAVMGEMVEAWSTRSLILQYVKNVADLIRKSGIIVGDVVPLEISHHYGVENLNEWGMAMLTIMNTEKYCKKYLVLAPDQGHPEQWHEVKKETFIVLHGTVSVRLRGLWKKYTVGDVIHIEPGDKHQFESDDGCIIEEISTTHNVADSFYTDESINKNMNRKTYVGYWGGM